MQHKVRWSGTQGPILPLILNRLYFWMPSDAVVSGAVNSKPFWDGGPNVCQRANPIKFTRDFVITQWHKFRWAYVSTWTYVIDAALSTMLPLLYCSCTPQFCSSGPATTHMCALNRGPISFYAVQINLQLKRSLKIISNYFRATMAYMRNLTLPSQNG